MSGWIVRLQVSAFILVVSFVVGLGAYFATAGRSSPVSVSPCGGCPPFFNEAFPGLTVYPPIYIERWEDAHFDPISGDPQGWSYTTPNRGGPGDVTTVGPVPPDMVGRWAVPIPLGFVVGGLASYALVAIRRLWRGRVRPVPEHVT